MRGLRAVEMRECGGEDSFAPDLALARVEPFYARANFLEWIGVQQFVENSFDAQLEDAVFGAETIGSDAFGECRDADQYRVGFHPPS